MKVSIVTVAYNCQEYIEDCMQSVIHQLYPDIEYIIIDGQSTDNTFNIIHKYQDYLNYYVSEPDKGMYDAINKGIDKATGEIIGILNADDYLVDIHVIKAVVQCVKENDCDAVYGNLNYVKRTETSKIVRKWLSNPLRLKDMELGWMPAHPTLFIKRKFFFIYGNYAVNLGTAADYDLILRFLYKHQLKAVFLDRLMVNMRTGGMSNGSVRKMYNALLYDYKVMIYNELPNPILALVLKKLRKIKQFL